MGKRSWKVAGPDGGQHSISGYYWVAEVRILCGLDSEDKAEQEKKLHAASEELVKQLNGNLLRKERARKEKK